MPILGRYHGLANRRREVFVSRFIGAAVIAVTVVAADGAQLSHESALRSSDPSRSFHHAIRTVNQDTQRLFDDGLTFYYGFNRDAAHRAFSDATRLDALAAMPHVGIALSLGPNLNMDADPPALRAACESARTALHVSQSATDRGYATAASARYCTLDGRVNAAAYVDAMNALRRNLPDDADASVLYADSLMELRPRATAQDVEIIAVLETVLRRYPSHVGANHLYIHAVEGSTTPLRASESAHRLDTFVPQIGHLVHMPSHIYMRSGDYDAAIAANIRAAAADLAYLQQHPPGHDGPMSYLHDLETLAVAFGFMGRFGEARAAAAEIARVEAGLADADQSQYFSAPLAFVLLRFGMWAAAAALPMPPSQDVLSSILARSARTEALLRLKRLPDAERERAAFERAASAIPDGTMYRSNPIEAVTDVFRALLDARRLEAEHNSIAAIATWQRAVEAEDRLIYHEPPPFYYPVRESLGAAFCKAGRPDQAERVFRDDLMRHPGNARSLFGLWQAQRALGRQADAESTHRRFAKAWAHADVELTLSTF